MSNSVLINLTEFLILYWSGVQILVMFNRGLKGETDLPGIPTSFYFLLFSTHSSPTELLGIVNKDHTKGRTKDKHHKTLRQYVRVKSGESVYIYIHTYTIYTDM